MVRTGVLYPVVIRSVKFFTKFFWAGKSLIPFGNTLGQGGKHR